MTPTDCAVTQWASVGEPRRWLRQRLGFLFKSVELPSDVLSITKRRFAALLRQLPLADALTRSTRTRLRAPFRETQPSIKGENFAIRRMVVGKAELEAEAVSVAHVVGES